MSNLEPLHNNPNYRCIPIGFCPTSSLGIVALNAYYPARDNLLTGRLPIIRAIKTIPDSRFRFPCGNNAIYMSSNSKALVRTIASFKSPHLDSQCYEIEAMIGGNLLEFIHFNPNYNDATALMLAYGVTRGLHDIHECNNSHMGLKPVNIMCDIYGRPKIADYGHIHTREISEEIDATSWMYLAPEVQSSRNIINGEQLHNIIIGGDIYSLGLIFIHIFGRMEEIFKFREGDKYDLLSVAEPGHYAQGLIREMLSIEPKSRPTTTAIMKQLIGMAKNKMLSNWTPTGHFHDASPFDEYLRYIMARDNDLPDTGDLSLYTEREIAISVSVALHRLLALIDKARYDASGVKNMHLLWAIFQRSFWCVKQGDIAIAQDLCDIMSEIGFSIHEIRDAMPNDLSYQNQNSFYWKHAYVMRERPIKPPPSFIQPTFIYEKPEVVAPPIQGRVNVALRFRYFTH